MTDEAQRIVRAGLAGLILQTGSLIVALGALSAVLVWLGQPRIEAWVRELVRSTVSEIAATASRNSDALAMVSENMGAIADRLEDMEARVGRQSGPALRFAPEGSQITNTRVGKLATITWRFFKLAECGRPRVDLFFRDGQGIIHRFEDVSILDEQGRGVSFPADSYAARELTYSARIPNNEGVRPGAATGWVLLDYSDKCPSSPTVASPEVNFRILP